MKTLNLHRYIGLGVIAAFTAGCDIDQTREGEMPDVSVDPGQLPEYEVRQTQEGQLPDVDIAGGQLPAYDIDTVDIDLETQKMKVKVPDVDVTMKEKTITVPDIDVELPDADRVDDNGS